MNIFKILNEKKNCQKKNCKEIYEKFNNERKIYLKYIVNYFDNSEAHKKYITTKYNLNLNYFKEINNKINTNNKKILIKNKYKKLNKDNYKKYRNTTDYKNFKKTENIFLNSKFKKQLDKCGFNNCIEIYINEIIYLKKIYKNNKKILNEINKYNLDNLKYSDYLKIISITKKNKLFIK
jgi:hypothetical protein